MRRFKNSAMQGAWDECQRKWGKAWAQLDLLHQKRELESAMLYVLSGCSNLSDAEVFRKHFCEAMKELTAFLYDEVAK